MEAAWTRTPEDVLAHFQVDQDTGLSAAHVAKNQEVYGKNGAGSEMLRAFSVLTLLLCRAPRGPLDAFMGANS